MKKLFSFSLVTLFLLILFAYPGYSQTAKDILEKMIEAQGGRKVLENIKDSTISGSMEMIQMGVTGSMTMYQKEPNKLRTDIEMMGMMITQAFDGKTAWMTNPQTGSAQEMPEKFAPYIKRQALGLDSLLNPEKYGITYADKDKETIEGKDYLVLEQTFSDGFKVTYYVNPETYLTYKTKTTTLNQMGVEVVAENFMSDFKEVEGTMVAHSIRVLQDGQEYMKVTITEVIFNSDLEDPLFQMSE